MFKTLPTILLILLFVFLIWEAIGIWVSRKERELEEEDENDDQSDGL